MSLSIQLKYFSFFCVDNKSIYKKQGIIKYRKFMIAPPWSSVFSK